MAKNCKILSRMSDGFLEVEYSDGPKKFVLSIPAAPVGHDDEELLDHLTANFPSNIFDEMNEPPSEALGRALGKKNVITSRVAAEQARRNNG